MTHQRQSCNESLFWLLLTKCSERPGASGESEVLLTTLRVLPPDQWIVLYIRHSSPSLGTVPPFAFFIPFLPLSVASPLSVLSPEETHLSSSLSFSLTLPLSIYSSLSRSLSTSPFPSLNLFLSLSFSLSLSIFPLHSLTRSWPHVWSVVIRARHSCLRELICPLSISVNKPPSSARVQSLMSTGPGLGISLSLYLSARLSFSLILFVSFSISLWGSSSVLCKSNPGISRNSHYSLVSFTSHTQSSPHQVAPKQTPHGFRHGLNSFWRQLSSLIWQTQTLSCSRQLTMATHKQACECRTFHFTKRKNS